MSNHPTATDPNGITVSEHWCDTTVILDCAGVLDMLTAPELETRIAIALDKQPTSMIVDLTPTTFLASHGINVLVTAHYRCANTVFAVVADGYATWRPLQLTGLIGILTVHATLGDALGNLAASTR